jgi:exonuclease SbcC
MAQHSLIAWPVYGNATELTNARNALLRRISESEGYITTTLRAQLDLLQGRSATLDHTLADLIARRRADQSAFAASDKEMAVMARGWTALALEGAPSLSTLSQARARSEQTTLGLKRALERLQQAATGLEAWNNSQELARVSATLTATRQRVGAKTDEECSVKLTVLMAKASGAVDRAKKASRRAGEVAGELMERSAEFSRAALDPLSNRISAFHKLISPFRYEVEMTSHLTGTSGKAQARLVVPRLKGSRPTEEDPDLWLSEGQASALGLSVLLGASTVYPWSCWHALLLDDPLQNTDLIHAAAFGDVLRSLMKDDGYQVILSTHNPDEADFLLRKVRRAGLPVQRLELVSLGPEGVRYELREP